MDKQKQYATPTAFRRALEDRLKLIAGKERLTLERIRREVAFDRLLARLFSRENLPWALKGGYALELRLKEARATKDIDLAWRKIPGKEKPASLNTYLLQELRDAAELDMGDFFVFEFGDAIMDISATPSGGARFPVKALMDARTFVEFHVDIGVGDAVIMPLETIEGRDWLNFAGIPAAKITAISKEQHFAEKIHAYTIPRQTPNSRVRDIVDIVLLIQTGRLDKKKVANALAETFNRRKTHPIPAKLAPPPNDWGKAYATMAQECGLTKEIENAFKLLESYFDSL